MSDGRIRELERRYRESGDPEDGAQWVLARFRVGLLSPAELLGAALLGDPAAKAAQAELAYPPGGIDVDPGVHYADVAPITLDPATVELRQNWHITTDAEDVLSIEMGAKALGGVWSVRQIRLGDSNTARNTLLFETSYLGSAPEMPQAQTRCEAGHDWAPNWLWNPETQRATRQCVRVGCDATQSEFLAYARGHHPA